MDKQEQIEAVRAEFARLMDAIETLDEQALVRPNIGEVGRARDTRPHHGLDTHRHRYPSADRARRTSTTRGRRVRHGRHPQRGLRDGRRQPIGRRRDRRVAGGVRRVRRCGRSRAGRAVRRGPHGVSPHAGKRPATPPRTSHGNRVGSIHVSGRLSLEPISLGGSVSHSMGAILKELVADRNLLTHTIVHSNDRSTVQPYLPCTRSAALDQLIERANNPGIILRGPQGSTACCCRCCVLSDGTSTEGPSHSLELSVLYAHRCSVSDLRSN